MTDTENGPVCRATLAVSWVTKRTYDCVLPENHAGQHRDADNDTWDITYRDVPQCPVSLATADGRVQCSQRQWHESPHTVPPLVPAKPVTGLGSLEISDLSRRVTALEAAWTVGGETLSERLDRVILGMQENHRFVALRVEELEKDRHPEECHGEQCVKPRAVMLPTDEYFALLKDREELHALRNAAQMNVDSPPSVTDRLEFLERRSARLSALEQADVVTVQDYGDRDPVAGD